MRKLLVAAFVALLMAGCGGEINQPNFEKFVGPHGFIHDLSDPEVRERIFAKAIDYLDFERRFVDSHYTAFAPGQQMPYTGWAKKGGGLGTYKDGKLFTAVAWKPNGEKCPVTNIVNGNGVRVWYNLDGTERGRHTFKDGEIQF